MKIVKEMSLSDFMFWGDAQVFAKTLTEKEFNKVEENIENLYPDGLTDRALNNLFENEQDMVYSWLGKTEFPKWVVFKDMLRSERVIKVSNRQEEKEIRYLLNHYNIDDVDWYQSDDEPYTVDVSGDNLDAADFTEFDEWVWEEDLPHHLFSVSVPNSWAAAYENDDRSGLDDDDTAEFERFLADYKNELRDTDKYLHIWDMQNITYKDEPDYGHYSQYCCMLRIYEK